ncbi:MAG TPA: hypothetical protein DCR10_12090 [Acidimicrobiaceae bacterium]|nr:hypothetical protein [Acidimicrobiaceae bacterium]
MRRPDSALRLWATSLFVAALLIGTTACTASANFNEHPKPLSGLEGTSLLSVSEALPCPGEPVPTRVVVSCYWVEVEDASLAVAVLQASNPTGHPVLHLHGGPGGRAVADRHRWLIPQSPLLAHHDIVLVDQRGGGHSVPSLDCLEVDGSHTAELDSYRSCRRRLDAAGVDRSSITVDRIAADMVEVRKALGIERWHLHGASYGTRIALALLRTDGLAVASAILDSVVPPDIPTYDDLPDGVIASIGALGQWCNDLSPSCSGEIPDHLGTVLHHLAKEAITTTVTSGDTLRIDDTMFLRLVTDVLAGPAPHGPTIASTAIGTAYDGYAAGAAMTGITKSVALLSGALSAPVSTPARTTGDALSEGAQLSVECADELPDNNFVDTLPSQVPTGWEHQVATAIRDRWLDIRALCALWNVPASPASTHSPVRSDVPVLLLAGRLDPITPAAWSHHVLDDLSDAVLVLSDRWSHTPSMSDHCAAELVADFLDTGRRPESGPVDCPPNG